MSRVGEPSLFGGVIQRQDSEDENEMSDEGSEDGSVLEEDGEDSDEDDEEGGEGIGMIELKRSVNKIDVLRAKLEDVKSIDGKLPFSETLEISSREPLDIKDINDDLDREAHFYKAALEATDKAYIKLKEAKVPYQRPNDYFGEMLKTDEHMEKIKSKLIHENNETHQKIERRKQREQKKFGKRSQAEQQQQKVKKRKLEYELVKKWRKDRKAGKAGEFNLEEMEKEVVKAGEKKRKRDVRDEKKQSNNTKKSKKFGFGGKRVKGNTAESSANAAGWSSKKSWRK